MLAAIVHPEDCRFSLSRNGRIIAEGGIGILAVHLQSSAAVQNINLVNKPLFSMGFWYVNTGLSFKMTIYLNITKGFPPRILIHSLIHTQMDYFLENTHTQMYTL